MYQNFELDQILIFRQSLRIKNIFNLDRLKTYLIVTLKGKEEI